MKSWDEATKGSTLTIKRRYRRHSFRMLVDSVERMTVASNYAWVTGTRLRMDGKPSTRATTYGLAPGLRRELINIEDVVALGAPTTA